RARISPEFTADTGMHMLGEGLCQPVSQRLQYDGAVIIMRSFESLHPFVDTETGADREQADRIRNPRLARRDEISQRQIGPPGWFDRLLTECVIGHQDLTAMPVSIDLNVILVDRIGG